MQPLRVLVNRGAGSADDDAVTAVVRELRRSADVEVAATGTGAELSDAVSSAGGRRLVVIGGDGSVHAAVRALDRAGLLDPRRPLGVVARGTGNDLARSLGLPLDPRAAAQVVLAGRPRALDLLRDDGGGLVLNAVHAGVGVRAYAEATRVKDRLGTVAFPVGAVLAGTVDRGAALRVEVDGRVAAEPRGRWAADGRTRLLLAAVCNAPTLGGGRPVVPGARPDDGLADVLLVAATGPLARAAFGVALLRGRHLRRRDVLLLRGREVRIDGPGSGLDLDADGELEPAGTSRSWRVEHGAWSVLVPG